MLDLFSIDKKIFYFCVLIFFNYSTKILYNLKLILNKTFCVQWYSSKDFEGRSYYFEENSNESSWTLPGTSYSNTSNGSQSSIKADSEHSPSTLVEEKTNSEKNDSSELKYFILYIY